MSSFDHLRRTDEIRVLAFCIMPDHYHLLTFLIGRKSLSDVISSVGKYTARRVNALIGRRGRFWQEGFHDHRCRNDDDIEDRLNYIELNPVRAGLTEEPAGWPFSSAHPSRVGLLDRDWYANMR